MVLFLLELFRAGMVNELNQRVDMLIVLRLVVIEMLVQVCPFTYQVLSDLLSEGNLGFDLAKKALESQLETLLIVGCE